MIFKELFFPKNDDLITDPELLKKLSDTIGKEKRKIAFDIEVSTATPEEKRDAHEIAQQHYENLETLIENGTLRKEDLNPYSKG